MGAAKRNHRYAKLAAFLREEIAAGRYRLGQRLPTEPELCELCGVSRSTIRQAVAELVEEGLLRREQGRGTFVTGRPTASAHLASPAASLSAATAGQRFRVIKAGFAPASDELATQFGLPPESALFELVRLRLIDERPVAIKRYYLPADLLGQEPPSTEEIEGHWFDAILKHHGIYIARTNMLAKPVLIGGEDAALLEVIEGSLGMFAQRIGHNEAGRPVRLSRTVLASGRATLHWFVKHPYGADPSADTINFSAWTAATLD